MTSTAQELWNDIKFIEKRINEQGKYKFDLNQRFLRKEISLDRLDELDESAKAVYDRFVNRLKELKHGVV